MIHQPFFSVIVCTYNREKLIFRALKSLKQQEFQDFEIIVVDDGSLDGTKNLVKRFGNVRYLHQKNKGVGSARNYGIRRAAGKYITFLDSDDEYLENHLLLRHAYAIKYPRVDFFYGGYRLVGNPYVPDKDNPKKKIHLKYCLVGGTFVFKKEVFDSVGGFSEKRFAEDSDFFKKALKYGCGFKELQDKTYVYYRDHESSITHDLFRL